MSFEETLVCDACSTVLSGGQHRIELLEDLYDEGGHTYSEQRHGGWKPCGADRKWLGLGHFRHVCGRCEETKATKFFDGQEIPR